MKYEITQMNRKLKRGKIIATFTEEKLAKEYVEYMNKIDGKANEYFIW